LKNVHIDDSEFDIDANSMDVINKLWITNKLLECKIDEILIGIADYFVDNDSVSDCIEKLLNYFQSHNQEDETYFQTVFDLNQFEWQK